MPGNERRARVDEWRRGTQASNMQKRAQKTYGGAVAGKQGQGKVTVSKNGVTVRYRIAQGRRGRWGCGTGLHYMFRRRWGRLDGMSPRGNGALLGGLGWFEGGSCAGHERPARVGLPWAARALFPVGARPWRPRPCRGMPAALLQMLKELAPGAIVCRASWCVVVPTGSSSHRGGYGWAGRVVAGNSPVGQSGREAPGHSCATGRTLAGCKGPTPAAP